MKTISRILLICLCFAFAHPSLAVGPHATTVRQYRADTGQSVSFTTGVISLGVGVYFEANVTSDEGRTVRMEVELRKLPATFTGTPNYSTGLVSSGTRARTSTATGMTAGNWAWKYRIVDSAGVSTTWQPAGNPDFVVQGNDVDPPLISSVSPASMPASNNRQTLTINGSNFQSGATLTFDPPTGDNIDSSSTHLTLDSSSSIRYQINNANDDGAWRVRVNNPNGQSSNWETFTVTAAPQPVLTVTPDSPPPRPSTAGTISVSVNNTGSGTMSYSASVTPASSWLRINSGASGGNSGTIVVGYDANNTGASRSATIQVTAAGASGSPKTVTITQQAGSGNPMGLAVGERVRSAIGGANVRNDSLADVLFTQSEGVHGTITGGPVIATAGGFAGNWWKVSWDSQPPNQAATQGWSAESVISLTPTTGDIPKPDFSAGHYTTENIFYLSGNAPNASASAKANASGGAFSPIALGNCTWYAHGRLRELGYSTAQLIAMTGDASRWENQATDNGIPWDTTPTIGSIAQTDSGAGGLGHVAVVESVNAADGTITISESSYATTTSSPWNFLFRHRTVAANWFQRFIHVSKTQPPNYSITLINSPSAGGTVSGGGAYPAGSARTVTATANSGYTFANWTEGGNVVSTLASYPFTLNGNRTLVANFTANPQLYADLVPHNLGVSPSSGPAGSGVQVSFAVRNNGPGTSLATTANIRLSTSSSAPSSGDPLLGTVNIGALSNGAQQSFSPGYTIPAGTIAGQWHIWVIVEPTGAPNANQGPNIGNDLMSAAFTVTSVLPTTYSIAPNPATVGEDAGTLDFTITRSGSSLPEETIYASTTQTEGDSNSSDYATDINNLAVNFASGATTRTVTLTILNDTVSESSETFGFIVQRNASDPVSTYLDKTTFTITDNDPPAGDTDYAGAVWIAAGAGHFTPASRTSADITAIVIHTTEDASYGAAITWFQDPGGDTSAHYVVRRDGSVVQMVREKDIAHHAGTPGIAASWVWNERSIGIEVERLANTTEIIAGAQYQAVKSLVDSIRTRHDVPLVFPSATPVSSPITLVAGIVGHGKAVQNGIDPVKWDWTYFQSLFGINEDDTPPLLSINSPADGTAVTSSSVSVSGTATDSGRGDSGITSVTVNGVRASNDTAAGGGTANWSRAVALVTGANTITVVATDGVGNQMTSSRSVNFIPSLDAPRVKPISGATSSGFTANWEISAGAIGYRLDVATDSAFSVFVSGYENRDVGSALSVSIDGLIPGTTYHCRVRAYSESSTSESSEAVISQTSTGLLSHWRFDARDARDSSGNANDGIVMGVNSWETGISGLAPVFTGGDEKIDYVPDAYLPLLTVSVWVKVAAGTPAVGYALIINGWTQRENFFLAINGNRFNARFHPAVSPTVYYQEIGIDSRNPFVAETYYHVAMTYDGERLRLFINGALDGEVERTGETYTAQASLFPDIHVGGTPSGGRAFRGTLDELKIYNRALSAEQIDAEYNGVLKPRLAIKQMEGLLVLSWPANRTGVKLESKGHLQDAQWSPVQSPPSVVDGYNTMSIAAGDGARFYRLLEE